MNNHSPLHHVGERAFRDTRDFTGVLSQVLGAELLCNIHASAGRVPKVGADIDPIPRRCGTAPTIISSLVAGIILLEARDTHDGMEQCQTVNVAVASEVIDQSLLVHIRYYSPVTHSAL